METKYGIVNLFAGAGGFGEGFSVAGRKNGEKMSVAASVEMNSHAAATLRLRAFLRKFRNGYPKAYYQALNAGGPMPDWSKTHADRWAKAESEVLELVLGSKESKQRISKMVRNVRKGYGENTILIGGPPCQAYSIAGRSKNRSIESYIPEKDNRYFLYREYVSILKSLRPAIFVMENVRGMLSSRVNDRMIFDQILEDLSGTDGGYRLLPLCLPVQEEDGSLCPSDFLVRAEDYGVPQARHRVFLVGLRNDRAKCLETGQELLGDGCSVQETVQDALEGLSSLRSGLSQGEDSHRSWKKAVREGAGRVLESLEDPALQGVARRFLANGLASFQERTCPGVPSSRELSRSGFRRWVEDRNLTRYPNHETRGHLRDDLARYFFVSIYGAVYRSSPKLPDFPEWLLPNHRNRDSGYFMDRFRVQVEGKPSSTITSHISKDGHYYIHPDVRQCRSLTVREAARMQTFPDNYFFCGPRTEQYRQVGNAVPPYLAYKIGRVVQRLVTA